jgi:excisionase family DNA binding protein
MAKLLGTLDVARRLGVSEPTVRKFADTGVLPVERTEGGRRVYTAAAVERLVVKREAAERNRGGGGRG